MKNWETSLAGVVGGIVIIANKYWDLGLPAEVVISIVIGAVALLAKDKSTTGIGKDATKEE